jgi:hypothetical protein
VDVLSQAQHLERLIASIPRRKVCPRTKPPSTRRELEPNPHMNGPYSGLDIGLVPFRQDIRK